MCRTNLYFGMTKRSVIGREFVFVTIGEISEINHLLLRIYGRRVQLQFYHGLCLYLIHEGSSIPILIVSSVEHVAAIANVDLFSCARNNMVSNLLSQSICDKHQQHTHINKI